MSEHTSYCEKLGIKELKHISLPPLTGIRRQTPGDDVMADVGQIVKPGISVPVDHVLELAPIGEHYVVHAFVLICKQRPLQLWIMSQPPAVLPKIEDVEMAAIALLVPENATAADIQNKIGVAENLQWLCHPNWDNQHAGNPSFIGAGADDPADLLNRCEELDKRIRGLMDKAKDAKAKDEQVIADIASVRGKAATWEDWSLPANAISLAELELGDLGGNLSIIACAYPLEEQLPIHPDVFKLWMVDQWMQNTDRSPGPPSTEDLLAAFDTCWRESQGLDAAPAEDTVHQNAIDALKALSDVLAIPIGTSMEAKLMKLPAESSALREQAYEMVHAPREGQLNTPESRRAFCERLSHDLSHVTLF